MTAVVCPRLPVPDSFSMEERLFRPQPLVDAELRLRRLEATIAADLEVLRYPSTPLPYTPRAGTLEVAIVGAGQTGKSIAFGLRRYGCHNVKVFDQRPKGLQGPWRTYGRNHLLRTKKESTGGMEWGIPNLHFQRWADARYGEDYFTGIRKIPRLVWADYLDWYGDILRLPVDYDVKVESVDWNGAARCFDLVTSNGPVRAQFVVICAGIESAGLYRFPPQVTAALPRTAYSHTMEDMPGDRIVDRDIVMIGAGASAFDTANAALEAGARSVDMMVRRPDLPQAHRSCWGSKWNGYHRHYIDLPDALKWSYSLGDLDLGVPPPRDTYYEAIRDPRFTLYGSAGIDSLAFEDGKIVGSYGGRTFRHDYMICGTGSQNSVSDQCELAPLLPKIALWRDVFDPAGQDTHPELEGSPYLGTSLQFTPLDPGDSYLGRVYYLCSGVAHLSGFRCNLSGLQFAAPRVCHDISRQLFLDHADEVKAAFDTYNLWE